eukprot:gene10024-11086_t
MLQAREKIQQAPEKAQIGISYLQYLIDHEKNPHGLDWLTVNSISLADFS